jgi:hypothetical protein
MAVKHRQLARQVGVFIEHPSENSMDRSTSLALYSMRAWRSPSAPGSASPTVVVVSIATSLTPGSRQASAPTSYRDIDNLADDLSEI